MQKRGLGLGMVLHPICKALLLEQSILHCLNNLNCSAGDSLDLVVTVLSQI